MTFNRRNLNILLLLIAVCQVIAVVWFANRRQLPYIETRAVAALPVDSLNSQKDTAQTAVATQQPERSTETIETEKPARELKDIPTVSLKTTDIATMRDSHPFAREAKKVLSGRLEATDSASRREILNYCEHFRMAYNTRDIDFLRQVFSDDALIIVGHIVKTDPDKHITYSDRIKYYVRSKHEYLDRLKKIFDSGKKINVDFSDFKILRHPTMEGIYGVTLFQKYSAGDYSDEGNLFLLWDFRNPAMPEIHVRTWQAGKVGDDEKIDISDFNLY